MALQTTVEHVDGPEPVTVLTLEGELDAAAFEGVIDTVRGMYDAGTRILVLDLTGLWFISSSGLVAIHAAMRLMRGEAAPDTEQGWVALRAVQQEADAGQISTALRLVGVQDAIQKVLDRTGLGPLIPTYRDRAAALAGG
jgi:anti-anti-sigma factor